MASTYLTRTPSSAGNGNTWTFSAWVKRSDLSIAQFLIGSSTSASDFEDIRFNPNTGDLSYSRYLTTKQWGFDSNTYLRDVSGWYHIVVNRSGTTMNYYLNGVAQTKINEVTSTSTGDFNTTDELRIGSRPDSSLYFDGSMSHVHWIDGTAYDATAFGEYDANGVWKIIVEPSVTYGTNGFFILKDGNSVTDQSGNGNNFTVAGGTLTKTEDNPSNVFATMNPLAVTALTPTFSEGNTKYSSTGSFHLAASTFGVSSGKWYAEFKYNSGDYFRTGILVTDKLNEFTSGSIYPGRGTKGWDYYSDNGQIYNNALGTSYGNTYTTSDIIGIAVDLDNNYLYFSKNGTWQNSADPTSGATGTGGVDISSISGEFIYICGSIYAVTSGDGNVNFGNGYFGTTAVASAGTNASGNGIFEYDVPTGYTALSTKGLNL